jgi:hypothetical protein
VAKTRAPQQCDRKQRPPHYTIRSARAAPVPLSVSVAVPVVSGDFLGIHALLDQTIVAADSGGNDRESEGVSMWKLRHVPAQLASDGLREWMRTGLRVLRIVFWRRPGHTGL